jgi:PAS domain S-box-containing protein
MNEQKKQIIINGPTDSIVEQQLQGYQTRIANILESFTDAFFEVDFQWTVTYWNKEAERLLLMPRELIIGKNLWQVYRDAIPLKFYSEYHLAMCNKVSRRFEEYFTPQQKWFEVAVFPSEQGLSVCFKDITERKTAITELLEEKQKYADLFNLSPVPQWVYDFDTLRFLDVNEAAIVHYQYSREEFMHMTIKDVRPEEDVKFLDEILCANVSLGSFNKSTVRHKTKDGNIIHVCVEGNTIWFEGKNARLVMVIDRTAEILAIKAMEESIDRFNTVSKATSDAIWDWNILTGEMIWNQGIKGIFGHTKTSYTDQWWRDHVHPEDLDEVLKKFNNLISRQKTRVKLQYRFRCADETYRFVLDRAFLIFNPDGIPIRMIGSMQDISEQIKHIKAIEQHNCLLQEISWIQSHKIRSPLAKILGLISLIGHNTDLQAIQEIIPLLKISTQQLDNVLKEIATKVN